MFLIIQDSRKDNTTLMLVDRRKSKKYWWTHDFSIAYTGTKNEMDKAVKKLKYNNVRVVSYKEYLEQNRTVESKEIINDYVDSLQNLDWIISYEFEDIFREEYFSTTPFGDYSIRYFYYNKSYSLYFNDEKLFDLFDNYKAIDEVKKKANEDYKSRIKKVLKL